MARIVDRRLGNLIVADGLLGREAVDSALIEQERLARAGQFKPLGKILVDGGLLSRKHITDLLAAQNKRLLACCNCHLQYNVADYNIRREYSCPKCGGSLEIPGELNTLTFEDEIAQPETADLEPPTAATGSPTLPKPTATHARKKRTRTAATPKKIGEYEVVREIGRGGMGVVYEAVQRSLDRRVALKVLLANLTTERRTIERFKREARAAARLAHENIVPIIGLEQQGDLHYYVMEFVDGKPLDQLVAEEPMEPVRAAGIIRQIAEALAYAHGMGIIHRDVKPSNVLLDERDRAHLADFGLAKPTEGSSSITASGTIMGTPSYMSPEQAEGLAGVDHRADLYSLGATLYELVTRVPPFVDASPLAVLRMVKNDDPTPPRKLNPAVPRALENVILKTLEKDRDRRYQSGAELAEDLTAFVEGRPVTARARSFSDRLGRIIERNRQMVYTSLFFSVVLFAVVIVFTVKTGPKIDDEGAAPQEVRQPEGAAPVTLAAARTHKFPTKDERKKEKRRRVGRPQKNSVTPPRKTGATIRPPRPNRGGTYLQRTAPIALADLERGLVDERSIEALRAEARRFPAMVLQMLTPEVGNLDLARVLIGLGSAHPSSAALLLPRFLDQNLFSGVERAAAAVAISATGTAQAYRTLLPSELDEQDAAVRRAMAGGLAYLTRKLGTRRASKILASDLDLAARALARSSSAEQRALVAGLFGELRGKEQLPLVLFPLGDALFDRDRQVRLAAARGLAGHIVARTSKRAWFHWVRGAYMARDDEVAAILQKAFREVARRAGTGAMKRRGIPEPLRAYMAHLDGNHEIEDEVRRMALGLAERMLARRHPDLAQELGQQVLRREKRAKVRLWAARFIGQATEAYDVVLLRRAQEREKKGEVKAAIRKAIENLGSKRRLDRSGGLDDPDRWKEIRRRRRRGEGWRGGRGWRRGRDE